LGGQLGIDLERIWSEAEDSCEDSTWDADVDENDVLLTPLSSGTTGKFLFLNCLTCFEGLPKCVMLTHRNFNVQTEILKE
jgi:long-subunit acyl-CoA synthetase (AMP-forming)